MPATDAEGGGDEPLPRPEGGGDEPDEPLVRQDCRHYSTRTVSADEVVQRCRVDANLRAPFACPYGCIFFEPRSITDAGWQRFDRDE